MALRMAKDLIIPAEDPRLKIVHRADPVDTWYGMDVYMLTKEDIDALISGKCLYGDNCEYSLLLYYQEEE